jgi:hypothetical protein
MEWMFIFGVKKELHMYESILFPWYAFMAWCSVKAQVVVMMEML